MSSVIAPVGPETILSKSFGKASGRNPAVAHRLTVDETVSYEGVARLRAARTTHGQFSVEGVVSRWCRRYFRNGYRSVRDLDNGTINRENARAHMDG